MHEFIRNNPFATLVTNSEFGLEAHHLPVYLNAENPDRLLLQGHIAASNLLWKHTPNGQNSVLIFQGSNSYITPSWYPSKKTNGKVVPTWNYAAVHVKGTIEFIHDASWKLELLNKLTSHQEEKFSNPWSISDAPHEYIEKLLPAIVGFEIIVTEILGKFKLSQNQSQENREGVIHGLTEQGHEMAHQIPK